MNTTRSDVRLANEAWEAVMTSHARLTRLFGTEKMWGEVSMREYDVLYTLAKAGEPLRIGEVQQGVLVSQPALSRLVDRLVDRGLLARETDPDDARAVRISLTEQGAELQRQVGRVHARSVTRELNAALTETEMRELRRIAGKLAAGAPD